MKIGKLSADQQQHDQCDPEVRPLPRVAESFRKASARSFGPRPLVQLSNSQGRQRHQHGDERDAVDDEGPAGPDRGNREACDGRSDHAGRIERGRVERDRVDQILVADQLTDEGLAGGRIECRSAAEQECEDIDVPQLNDVRYGQQPQRERERTHCRLRDHQQLALVENVGG